MKKKYYILLIVISFITTGCNATYDLDISNNGYKEKLKIQASTLNENNDIIEISLPVDINSPEGDGDSTKKIEGIDYYKSKIEEIDNYKSLIYSNTFNNNNFKNSYIINSSFSRFIVKQYDYDDDGKKDYIMVSTTNDFNKFGDSRLRNVTINITCHYKVISNNADEKTGNTYTWYLTKNNLKEINLIYDPGNELTSKNDLLSKIIKSPNLILCIILLIILIIGFVIKQYLNIKN